MALAFNAKLILLGWDGGFVWVLDSTVGGFYELRKRGGEKETREMWLLSLGRASTGLREQIKEWPLRKMALPSVCGELGLAWTRETLAAGSLWDGGTRGHVDFIGVHSFCSRYLLCFCAFCDVHTHTHRHRHWIVHTFHAFPLSLCWNGYCVHDRCASFHWRGSLANSH